MILTVPHHQVDCAGQRKEALKVEKLGRMGAMEIRVVLPFGVLDHLGAHLLLRHGVLLVGDHHHVVMGHVLHGTGAGLEKVQRQHDVLAGKVLDVREVLEAEDNEVTQVPNVVGYHLYADIVVQVEYLQSTDIQNALGDGVESVETDIESLDV